MKKKRKALSTESSWEPDWVRDDRPPRTTPYTEEELDLLTDGVIQGIDDTPAGRNMVREHGEGEARRILRDAIYASGPGILNPKPNPN